MIDLLPQFLAEMSDLLDQVDSGLLALERDPADRGVLDEVFRAAHTLKGSSGLFDLQALTRLTHAAEDLLDAVRSGRLDLTPALTDDLLAAFDVVRRWHGDLTASGALPADAATVGAALATRLRAPIGGDAEVPLPRTGTGPDADGDPEAVGVLPPAPGWLLDALGEDEVRRLQDWLELARTRCRVLRYTPEAQCFFSGEDPLHTVSQIPALESLAIRPTRPWPALDDFDEYDSVLAFTAATRATLPELHHHFRWWRDEVEFAQVDASTLAGLLAGPAPDEARVARPTGASEAVVAAAVGVLTAQAGALRDADPAIRTPHWLASVQAAVAAVLPTLGAGEDDVTALTAALAGDDLQQASELLEAFLARAVTSPPPADDVPAASPAPPARTDPNAADAPDGSSGDAGGAFGGAFSGAPGGAPGGGPGGRPGGRAPSRVLKVDQGVVDRLLDVVGQLVVAKNAVPFLATAAEEEWNARGLARLLKDHYAIVNRITEELQAAVMDVRMLPMSVAFARFPRLVRDLSRSLGKQVVLEQVGEDTAADKDIIEMLGDPLVHLVRNSLDHGIETPQERVAAGKPAEARLTLRATQEPDAVVIDVVDDGRGIDPNKIKLRAFERGLIDEDRLQSMTDEEAIDLIFVPGFSTAATVSDVSGRGVGMDAVRASVAAAGGTVRLTSVLGEGSQVRLRMPLSMAVSRVMIVTVDGQRFGVPVDVVVETVRVPRSRLQRVEHQDVIVLRDTVIPLVDLAQTLAGPGAGAADAALDDDLVSILVTRPEGCDVGFVVDGFQADTEVIVKPLDGILAGLPHYSGTALLGDGTVLLVLDVKEVMRDAGGDV